jgi:hypothetical protein
LLAQLSGALGGHGSVSSGKVVVKQGENISMRKCRQTLTPALSHPMGEGEQADVCWKVRTSNGCRRSFSSSTKNRARPTHQPAPNVCKSRFAVPSPVRRERLRVRATFISPFVPAAFPSAPKSP